MSDLAQRTEATDPGRVAFSEAVRVWARVAALSFGGPAGQIAVMHRIVVDEKGWVDERRFLHALNFCMLLPGPEAHQLAIYLGWLLNGVRGGLVAGALFVLPGFVAMLALSAAYVAWGATDLLTGLFFGLKAAVLALVLQAAVRLGGRTLRHPALRLLAAVAFVAILLGTPFPVVVLFAGLAGYLGSRAGLAAFRRPPEDRGPAEGPIVARRSLLLPSVLLALAWLVPVVLLRLLLGPDDVFARLAVFFSQMAVVTFGGAYAVLAYVAQAAVATYGWLQPGEMLDGLGLAETTPGPLIIVVQFVGFLAAFRDPGVLDPWLAAVLGATLVSWVTFVPSFLWIFVGAPYVERLRGNAGLNAALTAITAAVVGVIVSLALWFALHVIFPRQTTGTLLGREVELPEFASFDAAALVLTLAAIVAVFRFRAGMVPVLVLSTLFGLAWTMIAR